MFRAPRALPPFSVLLSDVPGGVREVAKYLGVTERAVWRWKAADAAPRAAMLALFWESRWGRSQFSADTYNEAKVHRELAQSLARENAQLHNLIAALEQVTPDTANQPIYSLTNSVNGRVAPRS